MKKIIAFTTSNSSTSINGKLIESIAKNYENVQILDLGEYAFPMYSMDLEKASGLDPQVEKLIEALSSADALIIATPEHNGLPTAYFKNIYDWLSRTRLKYLENKKVLIAGVSPGRGGAAKAIDVMSTLIGYTGAEIIGTFSLPTYSENFDEGNLRIENEELLTKLNEKLDLLSL